VTESGEKVLFVNHKSRRCGIYMFGVEISQQIAVSNQYDFQFVECDCAAELAALIAEKNPVALILNHHVITMPWGPSVAASFALPTVGIVHDVTTEMADRWSGPFFDVLVTHDPDLRTSNPLFMAAPRPLPQYRPIAAPPPDGPVRVGSFGFAANDKRFPELVALSAASFDRCVVRLHIPPADFVDREGTVVRAILEACRAAERQYPNVTLETSHDFLDRDQVLEFLASNHINVLLYVPDRGGGGISSASDWLLAAGRPLALRRGEMFRQFSSVNPSIYLDDNPLPVILANGTAPVDHLRERWSPMSVAVVYEQAVESAMSVTRQCARDDIALRRRASLFIDAETAAVTQRLESASRLDVRVQQLEQERAALVSDNQLLRRQAVWSPLRYAMAITRRLRHSS
jgi:hypothetical protein